MDSVWKFGPIAIGIGTVLLALGYPSIAIVSSTVLGMPTWFCGLLWVGFKSDEVLGVNHTYGYIDSNQKVE